MKIIAKVKCSNPKYCGIARNITKKKVVKKNSSKTLNRKKHGVMQTQPTFKPFMA